VCANNEGDPSLAPDPKDLFLDHMILVKSRNLVYCPVSAATPDALLKNLMAGEVS